MRLSRTTGAGAGMLVVLLGLWVGLIAFVGPYFHYGFSPDASWHFTLNRLWLVILPAVAAVAGGVMMIAAVTRASGVLGSWLALLGGVWLLIGPSMSMLWGHPAPGVLQSGIGAPLGGYYRAAADMIGVFYGAGALITMLSAFALGRFAFAEPLAAAPAGAAAARRRGYGREPRAASEPRAAEEPGVAEEQRVAGARGVAEEQRVAGEPGVAQEPDAAEAPRAVDETEAREQPAPRRGLIRRRRRGAAPPSERGESARPL